MLKNIKREVKIPKKKSHPPKPGLGPGNRSWTCEKKDHLKNTSIRKTGPQGLKDNADVIHFHLKSRGVQGFVLVHITF